MNVLPFPLFSLSISYVINDIWGRFYGLIEIVGDKLCKSNPKDQIES
jgi:hypothetical protein